MCIAKPKNPEPAALPAAPPPAPPSPEATAGSTVPAPLVNAEQTDKKAAKKVGKAGTRSLRIDLSVGGAPAVVGSGVNIPG